jgi:hypothetical protein
MPQHIRGGPRLALQPTTDTQKGKIMSNKNPFEIRAEMLQLAKDYMDQQYQMNVMFMQNMFDQGKKTAEELQESMQMYTVDELMQKAKEMYSFVSTKE